MGGAVVELLRQRNLAVRALVLHEDERTDALRAIGAEEVFNHTGEAWLNRSKITALSAIFELPP